MSLEIGPYRVELNTGKVSKNGEAMKWGGKASQLFSTLLAHSPQTITKDEIFAKVWKGRVVTENTLYKTISQLRKELNQDGIEIESMFGEGYRITSKVLPVEPVNTKNHILKWVGLFIVFGIVLMVLVAGFRWFEQRQLLSQMITLDKHLAVTKQAFISQINRRNELGDMLSQRFELKESDSWEKRFYQLYDQMNEQELFLCQQTRAFTEGPMFENNLAVLNLINDKTKLASELALSQEMVSHLTLWLNKYERVFKTAEKMCLLYVGVEDGAKYPSDFDQQVKDWIDKNQ